MIKVGFLVSYDYEYLKISLPLVYDHADKICLAIDINRSTWSGGSFIIPDTFFEWLRSIDTDKKIHILEDNFFVPTLSTSENDTRERNMLAEFMGEGGWHVQLDSDEYFYHFDDFVRYLKTKDHYLKDPEQNPISIAAYLITLFKKADAGYLYINSYESYRLVTNYPKYIMARNTGQKTIFTSYCIFHQSWARESAEIRKKIAAWGHSEDFDRAKYLEFWENVDENNYKDYRNIHPVYKKLWKRLYYGPGSTVQEFLYNYIKDHSLHVPFYIVLKKKITSTLGSFLKRK